MNDRFRPSVEPLEDRSVPALLASQVPLTLPLLEANEVQQLLQRGAAATASDDAIIAIVDRAGNILGVRVEAGVSLTGDDLIFAIDGAVSKARTAAFFANDTAPLTSRTVEFISQSTVTEREINANPNSADPLIYGPGYVAPIQIGSHFPPDISFTPQVDLFGIEHTNRDSFVAADGTLLPNRFNITAFAPGVDPNGVNPPLSYGDAIQADPRNPATHYQNRGIATLPGGIPLYEYGVLVGGIGVFFPGATGYATEENSILSADFDPTQPDRTLEAEFIGVAAAGGSSALGLSVGALGGVAALPGFDLPDGRIDLVGITLDVIGPGGDRGSFILVDYARANLGVGMGDPNSGVDVPVVFGGTQYLNGTTVPEGWIVAPQDGVGITAAQVEQIINQGITAANQVRAQIRLPLGERTAMVFAVADTTGEVLGLYRMHDATVFSIDVAVAKARNTAYYNDPTQLQPVDQVPGIPPGVAFTNRTFRYLSLPFFPEGIDGTGPAPFSILNDPGIDPNTGLQVGPRLPFTVYDSVYGYDSFNPGTNFQAPTSPANQNGIVFFPGSSGVYVNGVLVGGFGVSGDGVDQDDVVTAFGIAGFGPPNDLRVDNFFFAGVRLPYFKFPRNPLA